ncbi:MAG: hypothetical protein HHJ11_19750, partial [Phycicoccus sp.]|nr:hypothetical protein [Phycicoccus sp.]
MAKWMAVGAAGLMAVAVSGCSASPAVQVVPVKCPTKPPVILLMTDLAPGRLAPADATQGVMGAYAGVNDKAPEGSLTRSVPVADAAALAALLNEATPTPPGAVYHCPMDDGGIDAVVLARSSG